MLADCCCSHLMGLEALLVDCCVIFSVGFEYFVKPFDIAMQVGCKEYSVGNEAQKACHLQLDLDLDREDK